MVKESRVDVLIIGAGPSGLMCANALAVAGVDFRIIDNRSVDSLSVKDGELTNAGRLVYPLGKQMAYNLGRSKSFKYVHTYANQEN